jgi:hypothetical protein
MATDLDGKLKDKELKQVFSRDNKTVTAISLTVTLRGDRVREIQVYTTRKDQTGKKFLRILDDHDLPMRGLSTRLAASGWIALDSLINPSDRGQAPNDAHAGRA